jgi:hypothetical protein
LRAADGPSIFDETQPPAQRDSTQNKATDQRASKPSAGDGPTSVKSPVPDAASLAAADRMIEEVLGKDLQGSSPKARRQAAAKLLTQASDSTNVAEQFALLRRARQMAATVGDAATTFAAVRETAARFVVDERALRAEALKALAKSAQGVFDEETTIREALRAMDEAVRADDYPGAMVVAGEVKPLADGLGTSEMALCLTDAIRWVRELAQEYPSVKQAQRKLQTAPADPGANGVVGRFRCLRKHDWRGGLALLARGSDPKLRALAAAEMAAAATRVGDGDPDAAAAFGVAEGWWNYSLSQAAVIRLAVQAHAGDWYSFAGSGVTGMRKLQVRERVAAAARARARVPGQGCSRWIVLLRSDDPSVWTHPAGTPADRNGFGADADTSVPDDIAFLRLRRMDTGEFVVIPMKKQDLRKNIPIWCGSAWEGYGGTHLGIKNPKTQRVEAGLVDMDAHYQGWGFGHVMYASGDAAHGYAWAGVTIRKTIFEIAVTSDALTPSERQVLVVAK